MILKKSKTEFKNKLIDITIKNKNGYTINLNLKNPKYKKGYYIAITDNSNKDIKKAIENIIKIKEKKYKNIKKGLFFGGWFDDEKIKKYYIDLSIYSKSKNIALLLGKIFNQKAIFNIKTLKSIYL